MRCLQVFEQAATGEIPKIGEQFLALNVLQPPGRAFQGSREHERGDPNPDLNARVSLNVGRA